MRGWGFKLACALAAAALQFAGCNAIFGIEALTYDRYGSGGDTATPVISGGGGQAGQGGAVAAGAPTGSGGGTAAHGAAAGHGGQGGQGGVGPVGSVPCDVTPCDVSGGGRCCLPREADAGAPSCAPAGTLCATGYTSISCDRSDDCMQGEVCCGRFNLAQYAYEALACALDCTGANHYIFCDPSEDPSPCVAPDVCQPSTVLPAGYYNCR